MSDYLCTLPDKDLLHVCGQDANSISVNILDVLFQHRRTPETDACRDSTCIECYAKHLPHVRRAVLRGEPVPTILVGFPMKNQIKTGHNRPDLAELMAIQRLAAMAIRVSNVYPPGMLLTLASDGFVFNGILGVERYDVQAYSQTLRYWTTLYGPGSFRHVTLADIVGGGTPAEMRMRLEPYTETQEDLHALVLNDSQVAETLRGIILYHHDDLRAASPEAPRKKLQKIAKSKAYETIRLARAYSKVVAQAYPHAVRLSCHSYPSHAEKIGIALVGDESRTPWNSVAVATPLGIRLMTLREAEALPGHWMGDPDMPVESPVYYQVDISAFTSMALP